MPFITHLASLRTPVSTYANLPLTGNVQGDLRIATDTGDAYTWMLVASSGSLTDWNKVTTAAYSDLIGAPYSTALDIDNAVKVITGLSINIALLAFNTLTGYWSSLAKMFDGIINQFTAEDSGLEVADCENQRYVNIQENVSGGYYLPDKGDLDIYTRMLIHGDGVQDSTSFIDLLRQPLTSSNAKVDLSIKKFGTGSIKFNGTNSSLAISDSSGIIMGKYMKSDFYSEPMCLDFWFYSLASGLQPILANIAYDDGYGKTYDAGEYISIQRKANGKIYANIIVTTNMGMTDTLIEVESSSTISDNVWHHIAIQKVDGYLQIWIDGSLDATSVAHVESENSGCQALLKFGQLDTSFLNGHLDEIRLSNTERYTTTFTPMTKAYNTATTPAPTPEIVDESDSEHEVTVHGNARMSGTNPLFGNASLYLDGINSYLSLADSEDWFLSEFGSGFDSDNLLNESSFIKLLLHLNNDVVDSSINGRTVTNSNVTFSDTTKKLGTYAGVFNGTSAGLSVADSDDFYFGSDPFTVDFWVNFNTLNNNDMFTLFSIRDDGNNLMFAYLQKYSGQIHLVLTAYSNGSEIVTIDQIVSLSTATWYHIAFIRGWNYDSNLWAITLNGTVIGTSSRSGSLKNYSSPLCFGKDGTYGIYLNGYMDEIRVTKGMAQWTSNFTPSTIEYNAGGVASADSSSNPASQSCDNNTGTAWYTTPGAFPHWWKYDFGSGVTKAITKIRLLQHSLNGYLKDFQFQGSNDDSNWTTVYSGQYLNNASWQEFTFSNSTAYRYYRIYQANPGWSGSNYLQLTECQMMETTPGSQFTVDLWVCPLLLNDLDTYIIGVEDSWKLTLDGTSNKYLKFSVIGGNSIIAPLSLSLETWNHIAIVQSVSGLKLYVNGIFGASTSGSSMINTSTNLTIGATSTGTHLFNGFIEEVRISKGIARWINNFTPPSVEYTSDSNTKLLLPLNVQTVPNMVLQSEGYVANYVPTSARVVIFEEDIDTMEPNVDLVVALSRDGGTTFTNVTIAKDQEFGDGTLNLFTGSVDLTSQPSGELMVWKLTTQNNKDCRIRGISMNWR